MTSHHNAYARAATAALSGRDLEAAALMACAAQLQKLADHPHSRDEANATLARNRRLWTILSTSQNEALPSEIRSNVAALAQFVFGRTIELSWECTPQKLKPLIEINRNIAAGLRDRPIAA